MFASICSSVKDYRFEIRIIKAKNVLPDDPRDGIQYKVHNGFVNRDCFTECQPDGMYFSSHTLDNFVLLHYLVEQVLTYLQDSRNTHNNMHPTLDFIRNDQDHFNNLARLKVFLCDAIAKQPEQREPFYLSQP